MQCTRDLSGSQSIIFKVHDVIKKELLKIKENKNAKDEHLKNMCLLQQEPMLQTSHYNRYQVNDFPLCDSFYSLQHA